jgi:putative transferase (TIGR04331 family)
MFYYCNVPAWPRYEEYLDQRSDFVRALSVRAREDLRVRLPVDDGGWGMRARLLKAVPDLQWEDAHGSMIERARAARLTVVDHPQTSALELIAADIPTVFFWDPVLWPMRESARPWLDELKSAGVLYDTPQQAAHQIDKILVDPERWWRSTDVVKAVSSFRSRFAGGHQNWDHLWVRRLHQLEKEAKP